MECAWNCAKCTYENLPEAKACDMCATKREWREPEVSSKPLFRGEVSIAELAAGSLREVKILDQYTQEELKGLVKKHGTTKSICGYCCMGVAKLLASELALHQFERRITATSEGSGLELDASNPMSLPVIITKTLFNVKLLTPFISDAMAYVQGDRKEYVRNNGHLFDSQEAKDAYVTAWVANYEISDYIQSIEKHGKHVVFLRRNQMPDIDEATHVEKELLLKEEACFGEDMFILEFCAPKLLAPCTPSSFAAACRARDISKESILWILDLKGHYNCAFTTRVTNPATREETPTVVILDTYLANHVNNPTARKCLDLVYG